MVEIGTFACDRQGKQFADIWQEMKPLAKAILSVVNDPAARNRMIAVTIHLDLPALAGVVRELEHNPLIHKFFQATRRPNTLRVRQFVGVAVRMAMEEMGFKTTGRKGYLSM